MKRLLMVVFFIGSASANATLTLQLNASAVRAGQSFQLVLTQDDPQSVAIPDISPLQKDFRIIGTQRNNNYTIINGKVSSSNQWIIELMPKKTGKLTIPVIKAGQEQTQLLFVDVSDAKPDLDSSSSSLTDDTPTAMLRVQVSNEKPYINEQVIYTVKLYNSRQLMDAAYQPPSMKEGLLIPIGKEKQYQVVENGYTYSVDEQQYAIFPQKSGEVSITPPIFKAMTYESEPQQITVKAEPLTLRVRPVPSQLNQQHWLPAKQVILSDTFDQNRPQLLEGSTLTRTVVLDVVGLPAQLFPKLQFSSTDAFSVYSDTPVEKNTYRDGELLGSTQIKATYLLNHSGNIRIPAIQLPWFNTVTGKEEMALLPEKMITVIPLANQRNAKEDVAIRDNISSDVSASNTMTGSYPSMAAWLAVGFALAWLITLAIMWGRRQSATKKHVLAKLKSACLSNNPELARQALLDWACMQWPEKNRLHLADLMALIQDEAFKQEIQILSLISYSTQPKLWQGAALWGCVQSYRDKKPSKIINNNSLPPMNP